MAQRAITIRTVFACLLGFIAFLASATSTPAAETNEAKFIRLTEQLERDPLGDADKSVRTWLMDWVAESKEITVVVCDILGPIPTEKVPYGAELFTQSLFGNAAFQIAHPEQMQNKVAAQLAGVRSLLRAYAAILAKDPDAHIPYFDRLLTEDRGGSLEALLTPTIDQKCK